MGDLGVVMEPVLTDVANDRPQDPELKSVDDIEFFVPNISKLSFADPSGILLSWLLVLYRLSPSRNTDFGWGYGEGPRSLSSSTSAISSLSTASQSLNRNDALSLHLATVRQSISPDALSDSSDWQYKPGVLFLTSELHHEDAERQSISMWNFHMECKIQEHRVLFRPTWRSSKSDQFFVMMHIHTLADILKIVLSDPDKQITDCLHLRDHELGELRKWNQSLPPLVQECMHDLVAERARQHPNSQAICAWDGDFTYREVDEYSSALARHLLSVGVGPGIIVPICFEKSRWTTIATLAVMKAGAGFVLLDPSQPSVRLRTIVQEVLATVMLSSERQHDLAASIASRSNVIIVTLSMVEGWITQRIAPSRLPRVDPSSILYIIFTSGSTGKPKGVVIAHNTATSGALPRSEAVGYMSDTRVLDFASYAFDVSIDSMLCTLMRGGCLCIPSDEDRMNDLSGIMRRMGVTMANMTPSVARTLDADVIPSLSSLGLGGEAVSASDVAHWGQNTRIVIGYGPSECTVGCTINSSAANGKSYTNIGKGVGGVMWIVDPDNHDQLVPIGATGELLVEGPVVGQGYLNDLEKTDAVFVKDPTWLTNGTSVDARHGRLYKTGDLVKYDPDGSGNLVFVGRKDSQVKIRGQRVELGEVEYHLRSHLTKELFVAAEVIYPKRSTSDPTLVAFVSSSQQQDSETGSTLSLLYGDTELHQQLADVEKELVTKLPIYMVPSVYVPMNFIPILISAKTDRKRLREFGAALKLQEVSKLTASPNMKISLTSAELLLRELWSRILGLDEGHIGKQDQFFRLGGDSILAMKLVAAARKEQLSLSVTDIFQYPILHDMSTKISHDPSTKHDKIPPFSILSDTNLAVIRQEAATLCSVDAALIEDIYPCTPLQEVLMAFSTKDSHVYTAQRIMKVQSSEDETQLIAAWQYVFATSPILRTRIIHSPTHGLLQVVIGEKMKWSNCVDLRYYTEHDKSVPMELGDSLSRFAVVKDGTTGFSNFIWTVHHAAYDGWSTPLILDRVKHAFRGRKIVRSGHMKHFVKYLQDPTREDSKEYWRVQLRGAIGPQFPGLPSRNYLPKPTTRIDRFLKLDSMSSNITVPTLIRGAWALVAAQYTSSDDVIFGETMTGRTVTITAAEEIEGPMITTVPTRVRVHQGFSVQEYLEKIHEEAIARMPHEHTGLQHIRRVSKDAQLACELKTGLVIQPPIQSSTTNDKLLDSMMQTSDTDAAQEAVHFNTYPLMLVFSLQKDGLAVTASFDNKLIGPEMMGRVIDQLHVALQELSAKPTSLLSDINCLSQQDLAVLWQSSQLQDTTARRISQQLVPSCSEKLNISDELVHVSTPWIVDIRNADRLVPLGAVGELVLEGSYDSLDFKENPKWLIEGCEISPGRDGRLHKTGIFAKFTDDMSLCFVGNRSSHTVIGDRTIDLKEIEACIQKRLPTDTTVVVTKSSCGTDKLDNLLIAVLGWHSISGCVQDSVSIDSRHPMEIYLEMPRHLLQSLLVLEKSLTDIFPPYMIPTAFLPVRCGVLLISQETRSNLGRIGSNMSQDFAAELRSALRDLRERHRLQQIGEMTGNEQMLRALWSQILGLPLHEIQLEDSFFRLGGDSIQAMKLATAVHKEGYSLSVPNIFRNMQLAQMAKCLSSIEASSKTYKPFSIIQYERLDSFLTNYIRPKLKDPSWQVKDVLPVTERQLFDIAATTSKPRSSVQYNFLYLEPTAKTPELINCCQTLVDHHEILRTVFVKDNKSTSYLQVILRKLEIVFKEYKTNEEVEVFARQLCNKDVEEEFPLGAPFLRFTLIEGNVGQKCLVMRLSHAQYDGISLPQMMHQLGRIYAGDSVPVTPSFSFYIYYTQTENRSKDLRYWCSLLETSSMTRVCPVESNSDSLESTFITRLADVRLRPQETTFATLLASAWAILLARHNHIQDITFGSVVAGRTIDLPDVERIMGPTYQYMPLRVIIQDAWTTTDLLRFVQDQILSSSIHATVGLNEILTAINGPSSSLQFFESIVHHQDIDYFDSLPFGATSARVDYMIPHQEPAREWKIVSFPKDGKLCVGIEGRKSWTSFTEQKLDELVRIVTRLIDYPDALVLQL